MHGRIDQNTTIRILLLQAAKVVDSASMYVPFCENVQQIHHKRVRPLGLQVPHAIGVQIAKHQSGLCGYTRAEKSCQPTFQTHILAQIAGVPYV